jgi:hypothetical protein
MGVEGSPADGHAENSDHVGCDAAGGMVAGIQTAYGRRAHCIRLTDSAIAVSGSLGKPSRNARQETLRASLPETAAAFSEAHLWQTPAGRQTFVSGNSLTPSF